MGVFWYARTKKYTFNLITLKGTGNQKTKSLIFEIILGNGSRKRVNFSEFMVMRKEPCHKDGIYCTGFPEWRIIEGNNLKELDELLYTMFGEEVTIE